MVLDRHRELRWRLRWEAPQQLAHQISDVMRSDGDLIEKVRLVTDDGDSGLVVDRLRDAGCQRLHPTTLVFAVDGHWCRAIVRDIENHLHFSFMVVCARAITARANASVRPYLWEMPSVVFS